eukprot:CAMPEP_0172408064 /NCGR_PEP_ID=MMETSP1061-20121228/75660_1 /TAXON_ID=37318 /ORGANISM="Pseudo-nitzschia pungens, Strain cf. pungens" /LENGTH=230 /DNA_ID=CAMNT_0013144181 /DNA_START=479 /DNA_END=1170 /DNA_ORIENTATION=+
MKFQLLPLSSRRSILLPILPALLLLLVWGPLQTVEARVGNSNWNPNWNWNSNWNVQAENTIDSRPAQPQGQTSPATKIDADATTTATATTSADSVDGIRIREGPQAIGAVDSSATTTATATTSADSWMEFGFARVLKQSVLSIHHRSLGRGIGRSSSNSSSNDKMNTMNNSNNNNNSKSKSKSNARRRLNQEWARDENGKILWWIWVVIGASIAMCGLFCCCMSVCCLRD